MEPSDRCKSYLYYLQKINFMQYIFRNKNIDHLYLGFLILFTLIPRFGAIDNNAIRWFSVALISFLYVLYKISNKNFEIKLKKGTGLVLTLVFSYLFISSLNASNVNEGFITLYKYGIILCVGLITNNIFRKIEKPIITICYIFSISLVIEATFTIVDYMLSFENFRGIATNVNISSSSIVFKLPFVIYLLSKVKKGRIKMFLKIVEFISIVAILLLQSRLGQISTIIIYLFYLFLFNGIKYRYLMTLFFIGFFNFFINQTNTAESLDSNIISIENLNNDESINQRLTFYKKALEMSFEKPAFGYGLGSWKYESLKYFKNENKSILVPYYTHNDFLQIFFELGSLGLLIYMVFIGSLFKKSFFINDPFKGIIILSLILFTFNSLLNFPIHRTQEYIPFIIIASLIYSINGRKLNTLKYSSSLFLIIIIPAMILSYFEHSSLKIQNKLLSDYNTGTFTIDMKELDKINYHIPNLAANAVPISSYISRYYFQNNNLNKSLELLKYSQKANSNDLITKELLLRNYIFLDYKESAFKAANNLIQLYPDNQTYGQLYFSLISDLKIFNELIDNPIIYRSKNKIIHDMFFETINKDKSINPGLIKDLKMYSEKVFEE